MSTGICYFHCPTDGPCPYAYAYAASHAVTRAAPVLFAGILIGIFAGLAGLVCSTRHRRALRVAAVVPLVLVAGYLLALGWHDWGSVALAFWLAGLPVFVSYSLPSRPKHARFLTFCSILWVLSWPEVLFNFGSHWCIVTNPPAEIAKSFEWNGF